MTKYKILALLANHTNSQIKYNISLNNIYLIKNLVTDFCIIDSNNELYAQKLHNDINKIYKKNIINYFFFENNIYYDFGKWINALKNINYENYDYILFLNDSIIITPEISKYFIYIENVMDPKTQLYAYNDSGEIRYHYQSYLFLLFKDSIMTFIDFFENRKNNIYDQLSLVENIELNICNIVEKHDCFLKIADNYNISKNIYWENEKLYHFLLSKKIISIIKLKRIFDIQKIFKITIYGPSIENFDYKYYKSTYSDIHNFSDSELLNHFIHIGQYEGRRFNNDIITILPKYYKENLESIGLLEFFDIPEDFDIYYYKKFNPDLKNLSIIDTIFHFINNGFYEGRKYKESDENEKLNNFYCKLLYIDEKLPVEFNIYSYILLNNKYNTCGYLGGIYDYINSDRKEIYKKSILNSKIKNLDINIYKKVNNIKEDIDLNLIIQSYIIENNNKIYKIPLDFNHDLYKKLNIDLQYLSDEKLEEHYMLNGKNEGRIYKLPDDFDIETYKSLYKDLKSLSNEKIKEHYLLNGYKEGKIYKIPKDFNSTIYKKIYKDISNLSDIKAKEHYVNYGEKEGRIYKLPEDFNPFKYKSIYKDLENLNEEEIKNHYLFVGINENRKYKIPEDFDPIIYQKIYPNLNHLNEKELTDYYFNLDLCNNKFYKLPEDFDSNIYKSFYKDLEILNEQELKDHYLFYGIKEGRLYKLPSDFNHKIYKKIYSDLINLNNEELAIHYANIGIKEKRIYKIPDNFNSILYKEINEDLFNLNEKELIEHYLTHGIKEKRIYNLPKNFNHDNYRKLNKDLTKFTDQEITKHYLLYGFKEKRPYK